MTTGSSPADFSSAMTSSTCAFDTTDDHADAAVERAKHLGVIDVARLGEPAENGRRLERRKIDARGDVLRHDARDVLGKTAARDVRQRFDAPFNPDPPVARIAARSGLT